mgnify:CR=1 FL=1
MRNVHRTLAIDLDVTGDEKRVGVADQGLRGIVQVVEAFDHRSGSAGDAVDRALDLEGAAVDVQHAIAVLPDECRPGVTANLELLTRHAKTLHGQSDT